MTNELMGSIRLAENQIRESLELDALVMWLREIHYRTSIDHHSKL